MLTGIHFLLTYACTYECDHCFLFSSPSAEGTFTLEQLRTVFGEMDKIGTIEWVYFEGGEPFLYYPLMVEGVRLSRGKGYKTGVVSNAYWATAVEDAGLWLKPLYDHMIDDLSLSDDEFHSDNVEDSPAKRASAAARRIGMDADSICIEGPTVTSEKKIAKGEPIVGGSVMFRGRAVEKLTEGLPRRPTKTFTTCPHEDLEYLSRVHLDSFGHVHLCQGLSLGNMWQTPLSTLVKNYKPLSHPICRPLIQGGPAQLAKEYDVDLPDDFVDECHYCFEVRKALIDRFPDYLAPKQVYGLEEDPVKD